MLSSLCSVACENRALGVQRCLVTRLKTGKFGKGLLGGVRLLRSASSGGQDVLQHECGGSVANSLDNHRRCFSAHVHRLECLQNIECTRDRSEPESSGHPAEDVSLDSEHGAEDQEEESIGGRQRGIRVVDLIEQPAVWTCGRSGDARHMFRFAAELQLEDRRLGQRLVVIDRGDAASASDHAMRPNIAGTRNARPCCPCCFDFSSSVYPVMVMERAGAVESRCAPTYPGTRCRYSLNCVSGSRSFSRRSLDRRSALPCGSPQAAICRRAPASAHPLGAPASGPRGSPDGPARSALAHLNHAVRGSGTLTAAAPAIGLNAGTVWEACYGFMLAHRK